MEPTSDPLPEQRYHYQLRCAVEGRIRFLSHLETVDVLLSALRRAGARLALSKGFRPKPLIKVAMPRPVGVEAWDDIVEVELAVRMDPDDLAFRLMQVLPLGIVLQSVRELEGAYDSAASRVAGATFRVVVDGADSEELEAAVERFQASESVLVERRSPKRTRTVDVRAVTGEIAIIPGEPVVRCFVRLTDIGSAKPEEVVRALAQVGALELRVVRTIRESITLADPGSGGLVAEPALVGADVPDGPEKPWGAC